MSRLLMCPPDYFGIEYEINPWMRRSNQTNGDRARTQWKTLTQVLENKVGAKLEFMEPVPGLPDLVFTANAGVLYAGKAVPSRFLHPERQGEERHFIDWFTKKGYEVILLEDEMYFEGAGDLLGFPDFWIGGYRQRSDIRAYDELSKIFEKEILPVELVDKRFYHLDTCFCPLSGGELLYFPPAFDEYAQTVMATRIAEDKRFAVPTSEGQRFACNAVCVDRHVVLPTGCPETMAWLHTQGYTTHPVELDEFLKAGGSAKCLTLALD
ncbi:MAG: arginine deiminase-related protein [Nitrospirales bacterium]|nr:arginine deiminase-related protein [Nitrospirales bacterium]